MFSLLKANATRHNYKEGLDPRALRPEEFNFSEAIAPAIDNNLISQGVNLGVLEYYNRSGGVKRRKEHWRELYPQYADSFNKDLTQEAAIYMIKLAEDRKKYQKYAYYRNKTLESGAQGLFSKIAMEGATIPALNFVIESVDPTLLLPVVGQTAKGAGLATKLTRGAMSQQALSRSLGSFKGRAATGAIEGTAAGFMVAPIAAEYNKTILGGSYEESFASTVFGGAVAGTAIGGAFGVHRKFKVGKSTKEALSRLGIDPTLSTQEKLRAYGEYVANTDTFKKEVKTNNFFEDLDKRIKAGETPTPEHLYQAQELIKTKHAEFINNLYNNESQSNVTGVKGTLTEESWGQLFDDIEIAPEDLETVNQIVSEGFIQDISNMINRIKDSDSVEDIVALTEIDRMIQKYPALAKHPKFAEMMKNENLFTDFRNVLLRSVYNEQNLPQSLGDNPALRSFFETTQIRTGTQLENNLRKFLELFGRKLVITPYMPQGGTVYNKNANTIYINSMFFNLEASTSSGARKTMTQVVGHEFWHTLEHLSPGSAKIIFSRILKNIDDAEFNKLYEDHLARYPKMASEANKGNSLLQVREFTANMVGDLINTPQFWDELASILDKGTPQERASIASWFGEMMDNGFLNYMPQDIRRIKALAKTLKKNRDQILKEGLGNKNLGMADTIYKPFLEANEPRIQRALDGSEDREQASVTAHNYTKDLPVLTDESLAEGRKNLLADSLTKGLNALKRITQQSEAPEDIIKTELGDVTSTTDYKANHERFTDLEEGTSLELEDPVLKITADHVNAELEIREYIAGLGSAAKRVFKKIKSSRTLAGRNREAVKKLIDEGYDIDEAIKRVLAPQYQASLVREAVNRRARKVLANMDANTRKEYLAGTYGKQADLAGVGLNVARAKDVNRAQILGPFFNVLMKHGYVDRWDSTTDDTFVRNIIEVMEGKATDDAGIQEVADVLRELMDYQGGKLKQLGIITDTLDGYTFSTTHNRISILKNRDEWKNTITPLLDWDEISRFFDVSDDAKKSAFLDGVLKELEDAEDLSDSLTKLGKLDPTDPMVDSFSQNKDDLLMNTHRSLRFKEGSQYTYDKSKFGSGNPAKRILNQLMLTSDQITVTEHLGHDLDAIRSEHFSDWQGKTIFDYVTGLTDHPVDKRLSRIRRTVGQLTDLALLWKSGITAATSDPAYMTATARWMGIPTKEAYSRVADSIKQASKRNRFAISGNSKSAREFRGVGAGLDAIMNAVSRRFGGEYIINDESAGDSLFDKFSNSIARMHKQMFVLNGQAISTTIGQEAMVDLAQQHLADIANGRVVFNDDIAKSLQRFGITKEDLPALKKAVQEGSLYANDIEDAQLMFKVKSYLDEVMRMGVIEPDARTEAYLRLGFREGTPAGFAMRTVTKYMSFSMAQARQTYARALQGFSPEKAAEIARDPKKWAGVLADAHLTSFIGMAIMGAAVRQAIVDATRFRDPIAFNQEKFLQILQRSEAIPMVFDLMQRSGMDTFLGDDSLYGLGGPTVSMLAAPINEIGLPFVGDEASTYGVVNSFMNMTPGATIPFLQEGRKAALAASLDSYNQGYQSSLAFTENKFDQASLFRDSKKEDEE